MARTAKAEDLSEYQKAQIVEWYLKGRTIAQLVHRVDAQYTAISRFIKSEGMTRTFSDCAKMSGWQSRRIGGRL